MAHLNIASSIEPELPLAGGANGLPLTFCIAPSRRYFVAVHGGLIFEVLQVPMESLWRARIRVAVKDGAVIDSRIYAYEAVAEAKAWLQQRASLYMAEAQSCA